MLLPEVRGGNGSHGAKLVNFTKSACQDWNGSKKERVKIVWISIREAKKLTAWVLSSNGVFALDDPTFLVLFKECENAGANKINKTMEDVRIKILTWQKSVFSLDEKYGIKRIHLFAQCWMEECLDYLQYKKQKDNLGMPKDLQCHCQWCVAWMVRELPLLSIYQMNENSVDGLFGGVRVWRVGLGELVGQADAVDMLLVIPTLHLHLCKVHIPLPLQEIRLSTEYSCLEKCPKQCLPTESSFNITYMHTFLKNQDSVCRG